MDRPLLLLEHLQSVYETYLQIKDQALANTFLWLVPAIPSPYVGLSGLLP